MKAPKTVLLVALVCSFLAAHAEAQRPNRRGQGAVRWSADGVHLVADGATVDAVSGEPAQASKVEPKAEAEDPSAAFGEALREAGLPSFQLRGRRSFSTLPRAAEPAPGMITDAAGKSAALVQDGVLWGWRKGEKARKLREKVGALRRFDFSPDGSAVAYIDGFDLTITRLDGERTLRLSEDGSDDLFYGELDWVYQEEVYGRGDFQAAWWSPDSSHLAFLRIDESGVDTFTVVDHIPDQLGLEHLKYPKAGRVNPRATLQIADAATGKLTAVDLSGYKAEDEILIVRVGWTPKGDECFFMVQNREQTWLDLVFADPGTGKIRKAIEEKSAKGWVNVLSMPTWLVDGSFIWESERTGFKHLYRYDRSGKLLATITKGEWQVTNVIQVDETAGNVTYYGSKDQVVGSNAYRSNLDGTGFVRLTDGRGSHRISLNGDGSMLIDSWSSLENPGATAIRRADGSLVRMVDEQRIDEATRARVPALSEIKARDGQVLDVTVQLPADFDSSRKYPVWIDTYSGPDAPTVRDAWRGTDNWYVANGMIALQVNVRSASGRGQKFTEACYRQFGVRELQDIEDAIDWLVREQPAADPDRVGISGWSYGGYMTAYAMTHSKKFRCGVAGAGVHSWELYDTIYTERYMAKPQNNAEGYKLSSVIEGAKDLSGELLIVHGTIDDNVHMQNSIQLVQALQLAGKTNFQFMLYPKFRHGVNSPHLQKLRAEFIKKNMF